MSTPASAAPLATKLDQNSATKLHPELETGLGEWDKLLYGNHRIVVEVPELPENCPAVEVTLPWRRQDAKPQDIDVIVIAANSNKRVRNIFPGERNQESGTFTFEPIDGAGTYYFYYLPYVMGGHAYYPQAQYLPFRHIANPAWVREISNSVWSAEHGLSGSTAPKAKAVRYESADQWDSFAPMNFTATEAELNKITAENPDAKFMVFAQDRLHPISMKNAIPAHWAIKGPTGVPGKDARKVQSSVQPGEDYLLQLGLYALSNLEDVDVSFRNSHGLTATCLNTAGVDRKGNPFTQKLTVEEGRVQGLLINFKVPAEAAGETLNSTVTITTSQGRVEIPVELNVAKEADADIAAGGFGDPRELRRLAWLDSDLAQDDEVVAPFTAVELNERNRTLSILGRSLTLGENGLPAQIESTFTTAVTSTDGPAVALLSQPLNIVPEFLNASVDWDFSEISYTVHGPARLGWNCQWSSEQTPLTVTVEGQLEADGAAEFAVRLTLPAGQDSIGFSNVSLNAVFDADKVPFAMGLGVPGGTRPASIDWSWEVATKNQDSLWLGSSNVGVQISLRDDDYERPLNTNFYREKPLIAPESWANPQAENNTSGVALSEATGANGSDVVVLKAQSGPRTLDAGESLNYGFRLLLTPFKPIDPARQLRNRYFHDQGSIADIAATGASVINIHHATAVAPFINDPLLSAQGLSEYTQEAHQNGLKVKVYDTVRELTAHSPDLLPMLQLGHEIFSNGPGKGHIWPQEHAGENYVSAWYAPNVDDIAVVTAGESRLQNWYIRGLDEMVRKTGLDGIYLDDIAYDRQAMKRVRKVLAARCEDPEIDIHSANQFNEKDGFASSANMYMEQLPYTDRLWLGEYFDYDNTDPAYWLVEVSGIPFGLMGEMLEGGGNPWRGMAFGMTGRAPRVDNRPLWAFWAEHGLAEAEMVGHWATEVPVRTSNPEVLASSWITPRGLVTAIASWAPEAVDVTLEFAPEFAALAAASIEVEAIEGFQEAASYAAGASIRVEPKKGLLLVIQ